MEEFIGRENKSKMSDDQLLEAYQMLRIIFLEATHREVTFLLNELMLLRKYFLDA